MIKEMLPSIAYSILQIYMITITSYFIITGILCFKKPKQLPNIKPNKKFLILVPAHNEASVIEGIAENLKHLDYPDKLYDVVIIADGCTDDTATIVRKIGLKALEHTYLPGERKGKPYAIRYALEQINDYETRYDGICIYDADNLVSLNSLQEMMEISEPIVLDKNKKHTIEVVIDRLILKEGLERRLADSFEIALKLGEGIAIVFIVDGEEMLFSENFACLKCGATIEEVEPRLFSFNSPFGSCPECTGLGFKQNFAEELIILNPKLSVNEGAINVRPWNFKSSGYYHSFLKGLANHFGFSLDEPFEKISKKFRKVILNGTKEKITFEYESQSGRKWTFTKLFEGVIPELRRRYRETNSEGVRQEIEGYMKIKDCEICQGKRLRKEALSIYINNKNIAELTAFSIEDALTFFNTLKLSLRNEKIAYQILKEIKSRLIFLNNLGLNYLTLNRSVTTLSGGEAQRIRLATQIGSGLVGVLYILDEPSVGLHQKDNAKLIEALMHLRDIGNTLIIVEHDEETMWASDILVDIGPRAGKQGGEIIAFGTPEKVAKTKGSITGEYLSGKRKIKVNTKRRKNKEKYITIKGAQENNLQKIDVSIPLGTITCVTGVSGSGKSTLINDILYKSLSKSLNKRKERVGLHASIEGIENIDKIINIDQSPIGRTPRSNPATYTGTFDLIRELFASIKESKVRGYKAGRFSFNIKGGRCENCQGDGNIKIEMHFLPDVYVPCEVCGGERYNREILDIKYKGKSIADILNMTIKEAYYFFENLPRIKRKLETLIEVGLSYMQMGQPATTLSGGEAQRIKLALELSKRNTKKTMYILDEPTTGLHFFDIEKLLHILQRLADSGNTIVVIEHNLDVIKTADYILDLGPEGGTGGGFLVAYGTPEEVAKVKESYTGQYLKKSLGGSLYGRQNSK